MEADEHAKNVVEPFDQHRPRAVQHTTPPIIAAMSMPLPPTLVPVPTQQPFSPRVEPMQASTVSRKPSLAWGNSNTSNTSSFPLACGTAAGVLAMSQWQPLPNARSHASACQQEPSTSKPTVYSTNPSIARLQRRLDKSGPYNQPWQAPLDAPVGELFASCEAACEDLPRQCIWACCCPSCVSYSVRKQALHGDMTRYTCCNGAYICSGHLGEQTCPRCCLALEAICCLPASIRASRFMILDELRHSADTCDTCLINGEICCVETSVACSVLGCLLNADVPGQAHVGHSWLDCFLGPAWCWVGPCMQAQHKVALAQRDAYPHKTPPPMLTSPSEQVMSSGQVPALVLGCSTTKATRHAPVGQFKPGKIAPETPTCSQSHIDDGMFKSQLEVEQLQAQGGVMGGACPMGMMIPATPYGPMVLPPVPLLTQEQLLEQLNLMTQEQQVELLSAAVARQQQQLSQQQHLIEVAQRQVSPPKQE